MFEPTQAPHTPPGCPAVSLSSSICVGEATVNEQVTNFGPTAIVDLSEMEFTRLQQILCSHINSQSNGGDVETGMSNQNFLSGNAPRYQSLTLTTISSEAQNICPVICQSAATTNNDLVPANQNSGPVDFQELRMIMLSDCNLLPPSGQIAENHPNNTTGDSSGAGLVWSRPASDVIGLDKENENLGHISGPRTKSTVRVRLEDRFTSSPNDVPRCTEMPETGVTANNLVTIIPHPSQLIEAQQPGKCSPLVDSKAAPSSLQLVYSRLTLQNTTPGSADPSLTQTKCSLNCTESCPLLLAAKNKEISRSRNFSLCYKKDPKNKLLPKEVFVNTEDTSCTKSVKQRRRDRSQIDVKMERRVLSDIKNASQAASRPDHSEEKLSDIKQASLSQRKERHNLMERNRRRKIRVCCDQLNSLVPFCTVDTDKATTLQWSVAFLKYLQEKHGDTLKKEYEDALCRKPAKKLKVVKPEGAETASFQEAAGSSSLQDVK